MNFIRGFGVGLILGTSVLVGLLAFRAEPGTAGFTTTVVQILEPWYIAAGFGALGIFAFALTLISVGQIKSLRARRS